MKEAFEKIKERLEEESQYSCSHCMERAISIVSEVEAEYGNGKTNADRIRSMSDEELAEYIEPRWFDCSDFCEDFDAGCSYTCKHNKGAEFLLNWLKSPTTD